MPLITQLPICLNSQNSIQLTEDPGAELDLLLMQPPNTKTFDKSYGIDTSYLQQASSDPKRYVPIFSLEIREKLNKFTRNLSLVRARIYRVPDKKRTVFIEVFWRQTVIENSKRFEIDLK